MTLATNLPYLIFLAAYLVIFTLLFPTGSSQLHSHSYYDEFEPIIAQDRRDPLEISVLASFLLPNATDVKFSGHLDCSQIVCPEKNAFFSFFDRVLPPTSSHARFQSMNITLWYIPVAGEKKYISTTFHLDFDTDGYAGFSLPASSNELILFQGQFRYHLKSLISQPSDDSFSPTSQNAEDIPPEGSISFTLVDEAGTQTDKWLRKFYLLRTHTISDYIGFSIDPEILPHIPTWERYSRAIALTDYIISPFNPINTAHLYIYVPPTQTPATTLEITFSAPQQTLLSIISFQTIRNCFLNGRPARMRPTFSKLFVFIPNSIVRRHSSLTFTCPEAVLNLSSFHHQDIPGQFYIQFALSNRTSHSQNPNFLPQYTDTILLEDYTQLRQSSSILTQNASFLGYHEELATIHNSSSFERSTQSPPTPPTPPAIQRYNRVTSSDSPTGDPTLAVCQFTFTFSEDIPFHIVPHNTTHNTLKPLSFNLRLRGKTMETSTGLHWITGLSQKERQSTDEPPSLIYFSQSANDDSYSPFDQVVVSRFTMTSVNNTFSNLTLPYLSNLPNIFVEKSFQFHSSLSYDQVQVQYDNLGSIIHLQDIYDSPNTLLKKQSHYLSQDTITMTLYASLQYETSKTPQHYLSTQCIIRFHDTVTDIPAQPTIQKQPTFASQIEADPPLLQSYPIAPSLLIGDWEPVPILSEGFNIHVDLLAHDRSKFTITIDSITSDIVTLSLSFLGFSDFYFDGDYSRCTINGVIMEATNSNASSQGPTQDLVFDVFAAQVDTNQLFSSITHSFPQSYTDYPFRKRALSEFTTIDSPSNQSHINSSTRYRFHNQKDITVIPYGSVLEIQCDHAYITTNFTTINTFPSHFPTTLPQFHPQDDGTGYYEETYDPNASREFTNYDISNLAVPFRVTGSPHSGNKRTVGMIFFPLIRDPNLLGQTEKLVIGITIVGMALTLVLSAIFWKAISTYGTICFCCGSRIAVSTHHSDQLIEDLDDSHLTSIN